MQKLICVIKVVQYLLFFPGWPARYWVQQTRTILLLFQCTFLPISMRRLIWGHLLPEWHLLPQMAQSACDIWGLPEVDLLASSIQLNASIITPWKHHYLWGPWGWMPWMFQVSCIFPPHALVPLVLSKFLAEHVEGQLRLLFLVAPCWIEAPWLPTFLNICSEPQ